MTICSQVLNTLKTWEYVWRSMARCDSEAVEDVSTAARVRSYAAPSKFHTGKVVSCCNSWTSCWAGQGEERSPESLILNQFCNNFYQLATQEVFMDILYGRNLISKYIKIYFIWELDNYISPYMGPRQVKNPKNKAPFSRQLTITLKPQ